MQNGHSFTIYNASAGSGKTYTLVKEYLKLLFQSKQSEPFKRILAITFTNKAVAEMKSRIIEALTEFSKETILETETTMFTSLCEDLHIEAQTLHEKSKQLLNTILHNYAAFDISTIDGFTHRLIRTFAHDLKLPLNFEVELDQDTILQEAVDRLIARAGSDKALTKVLLDFAIEKADEDKSWDVSFDFNKIAKSLLNENDKNYIDGLKSKTLEDFKSLKIHLKKELVHTEKQIIKQANEVLDLIKGVGVEFTDFSRGTLPNHFKKASVLDIATLYNNMLEENISERKSIYNKGLSPDIAASIDALLPEIEILYKSVKAYVYRLKFLKNAYKNVTPLSVLNVINNELSNLKVEQNKMLISEFNTIISNQIKEQPTPFIYERLGEKFKHYFIDEFQDTSIVQWENLIPLLGNSLETETGTTTLVGDAKQAIYRWRGGKADQFINLFNKTVKPFPFVAQKIKNLPNNYRSFKAVVDFNNGFFKFLSKTVFSSVNYKALYEAAAQNIIKKEDGYVELSFLDIKKEDDRDELFPKKVLKIIAHSIEIGYALSDICILVRKKKEGVAIATYLSHNSIPIISSETLLINASPEVGFVNNILSLLVQPKNKEIKIKVLNYLSTFFNIKDPHTFFREHLRFNNQELFKSLESYKINLNYQNLLQLPLYDLVETIIRCFHLVKTSHAYIQFYLDIVLEYSNKKGSDISGFLDYFNKNKERFSVISPIGQDAVQIMTIHKSKGLEFPVVIFPYADLDIYRELEPKAWFSIEKEKYNGFPHLLLNYNKDFEQFGELGRSIFNKRQSELELDNINLLYVTLTRAIEQMYIVSNKTISVNGETNRKTYSGLLISYLQYLGLWKDTQETYSFGNQKREAKILKSTKKTKIQQEFISTAKETHNINVVTKSGLLWDTNTFDAIEKGNLIHDIMAKILVNEDVEKVIEDFINNGTIDLKQALQIKPLIFKIVEHPKLKTYFQSNSTIFNEREIITKQGAVLRPDRIVINNKNESVIIDYKTGLVNTKHHEQLQYYKDALEDMGILVQKRILVYIGEDVLVNIL